MPNRSSEPSATDSFYATLYLYADTVYRQTLAPGHTSTSGRAYVTIDVGALHIQANRWEDAQRLVDALTTAIDAAKASEAVA